MQLAQRSLPGEERVLRGEYQAADFSVPVQGVQGVWGALWPVILLAAVLVAALVAGLTWVHVRNKRRADLRTGQEAFAVYLVRVPKFLSDDETKGQESVQTLREKIAVMESIYASLGGLSPVSGFQAWLSGRATDVLSFEIVAHKGLVSFYCAIPVKHAAFFEQQVHAQYPDAFFDQITDYNMFSPTGTVVGAYITQKRPAYFPLRTYKDMEADPLNALTNTLSKVAEGDGVAIQVVVRPVHHSWRGTGVRVVQNLQKGMTLKEAMGEDVGGWFETKGDREKKAEKRKDRKLTPAEQKMLEGIEGKLSKAGLEVTLRLVASSASPDQAKGYLSNLINAFSHYSIYEFGNAFDKAIPRNASEFVRGFVQRTFSSQHRMILNSEELTSIFHLPLHSTDTPNINWLLARTAPPPTTLPTSGLHLGYSNYRAKRTDIYMTDTDRRRHMYVIGKTGSGKSEFMKQLVAQDLASGKGVAVIDPHGEFADGCLELIPEDRVDDVIYFNPSDTERPFGLNILEYDETKPEQKTFAVNELIAIFDQLYDLSKTGGPMFEQYMRNSALLIMDDPSTGSTLIEITKVLSDPEFRKKKLAACKNQVVVDFWTKEAEKAGGEASLANMVPYITSKLTAFISNDTMRPIIAQQKSSIDFRKVLDEGKILLVNLSKGKLGELNAALLGMILVSRLQLAAFSRVDQDESQRRDFYLYIDEFQNFITPTIATILSEARKYRLNLIMAHQYMGQLVKNGDTRIRDAVLGNVGSLFVARIGPEDVETFGKIFAPTFSGYDLQNTDMFTWNVKLLVNNAQQQPFTMKVGEPVKGSRRVAEALKAISRLEYGRDVASVERDIFSRAGIGKKSEKMLS